MCQEHSGRRCQDSDRAVILACPGVSSTHHLLLQKDRDSVLLQSNELFPLHKNGRNQIGNSPQPGYMRIKINPTKVPIYLFDAVNAENSDFANGHTLTITVDYCILFPVIVISIPSFLLGIEETQSLPSL